jgi:hypothetical protein
MALPPWILKFPVERVHPLHSKSINSLSRRAFIPSSWLEFEWSKDSSPCVIHHLKLVLIVECSSSMLILLEHCSLTVRGCPWATTWCGESWKVCITLLCDSEQLKGALTTPWEKKGLRETRFFVNPSTRMYDSLWIQTSGLNLVSLMCSCIYLFLLLLFIFLFRISCLVLHC